MLALWQVSLLSLCSWATPAPSLLLFGCQSWAAEMHQRKKMWPQAGCFRHLGGAVWLNTLSIRPPDSFSQLSCCWKIQNLLTPNYKPLPLPRRTFCRQKKVSTWRPSNGDLTFGIVQWWQGGLCSLFLIVVDVCLKTLSHGFSAVIPEQFPP